MTAPLRFGVLGCGDASTRLFIPGLLAAGSAELAAVASRDPARAQEVAGGLGPVAAGSYEDLLALDDVDVVYVGVPIALHAEWARRALEAGKHVYCEKSLAGSVEEALDLLALAESLELRVAEGFMYRFHTLLRTVRDLAASGEIGELRSFAGSFGFTLPPEDELRRDPRMQMGALNETGCYPVSAARQLLGEPDLVAARLREEKGIDVAGSALLGFERAGAAGFCDFGYDRSYLNRYELWGSAGRIQVDRSYTTPPDLEPVIRVTADEPREVTLPAENHFSGIIDAFARAIAESDGHDLFEGDARRQALAMEAVRVSAREGTVVRVAEVGP